MKAPYKFAITSDTVNYYTVAATGEVSLSAGVQYLDNDVVDWDTLELNYRRDMTFLGVLRSYSPEQVRFVRKGARILRYIHNTQGGIEALAYFAVYLLDKDTQKYQLLDYWTFDFSRASNQELYFGVALMEGGMSALLKANAQVNYNIPLNDPQATPVGTPFPEFNPVLPNLLPLTPGIPAGAVPPPPRPELIYCDGIPIQGKVQFVSAQEGETLDLFSPLRPDTPSFDSHIFSIGMGVTQTIGDYTVGTTGNPSPQKHPPESTKDETVCFTCTTKCTMNIQYDLGFRYQYDDTGTSNCTAVLAYQIWDGTTPSLNDWGFLIGPTHIIKQDDAAIDRGTSSPHLHWIGQSESFDLEPGQILVVGFAFLQSSGALFFDCKFFLDGYTDTSSIPPFLPPNSAIQLNYTFVPTSSVVRCITHAQLFDYLGALLSLNGGLLSTLYGRRSNLLSTAAPIVEDFDIDPTKVFFTCGDSLRGLSTVTITDPTYNDGQPTDVYIVPAIYTSMQDFAKDLLTDLCAGIGIEKNGIGTDVLVAESLYYFFDDDNADFIADLGTSIANFTMEPFNDYRGSSISIGQTDQQFDALNGPLETNSEVVLGTPVTRIQKQVDFKSPYRADPYGIELTRANIGNKTNINSSSDNDTFKLYVSSLNVELVTDLENAAGLSGYSETVEALRLRRATAIASGMPSTLLTPKVDPYSMYNLCWTPQRKALRALPWLMANYRGLAGELLAITAYKKNIKLIAANEVDVVTESNWINVSAMDKTYTPPFSRNEVTVARSHKTPLWKPYVFEFDSLVPVNLPLMMTPPGTPGGGKMYKKIKFTFTRDGIKYPLAGFVLEAGINPATNKTYHYRLLCSPTANIPDSL